MVKDKKDKEEKRNIVKMIIVVIVIIILAIVCVKCSHKESEIVTGYEQNVNEIMEIDHSEQQKAVDAIVEEGKMNVNYSPKAVFDGKTSVLFNVKNIKNNHAPIVFSIYDENGNCIYESKKIEQGYEMSKIELETELGKGIHDCSIKIGYAEEGNVSSVFPLSIEVR